MPRIPVMASLIAALVVSSVPTHALGQAPSAVVGQVIVVHDGDIKWSPGPGSLPPGAQFALIEGDLAKAEPITLRLRFPANYRIPPHFHSVIEHVTILSGTLHVGMGDTADYETGVALSEGSFAAMPAKMTHFAWSGPAGVTFQLHSVGPWSITYINPSDDPRSRK